MDDTDISRLSLRVLTVVSSIRSYLGNGQVDMDDI